MKIRFKDSFGKDLRNLKNKSILAKVQKAVENAEQAEIPQNIHQFKKLRGSSAYFRIKVGEYRIGVELEKDTLIFWRILSRREIYRYFP